MEYVFQDSICWIYLLVLTTYKGTSGSEKMTKHVYFGPNLAILRPKILIFMGVSKSFGTNITENHLDNLSALFFGQALDQVGQKCRYLAQNASFGPNLAVFGPKIQFFGGRE